jgi:hypothetical protein
MFKKAKDAALTASSEVASRVKVAANSVGEALPSRDSVRRGVGHALIGGGKLLIDPRAMIGELAVSVGSNLLSEPSQEWLLLEAHDNGLSVLLRGSEDQVRAFYTDRLAEGRSLLLCQVQAASSGAAKVQS